MKTNIDLQKIHTNIYKFIKAFPELQDKKRWTLSNSDKMPLDVMRSTLTHYVGFSKQKYNSSLFTIDEIIQIHRQNPHLNITFKLEKEDNIIAVDIEPEALQDSRFKNPFFNMNFLYSEWSTNKGIHGYVRNQKPTYVEKAIISLKKDINVELFTDNHFIMFTGDIIPYKPKNINNEWFYYLEEKRKDVEHMIINKTDIQNITSDDVLTSKENARVSSYMILFDKLADNINLNEEYHINKSDTEHRVICIVLNTLYNKDFELQIDHNKLKFYTYFVVKRLLPHREKFNKVINSSNFGKTTYLNYSIEKAYQFLAHSNGWN